MLLWQCVVLDISFATAGEELELEPTLGNPTSSFQLIPDFGLLSTFCIALSNDIQKRLIASMMQELSLAHTLSIPFFQEQRDVRFPLKTYMGRGVGIPYCWD